MPLKSVKFHRKVGRAINRANEIHEMKKYGRIFVEIYRKN